MNRPSCCKRTYLLFSRVECIHIVVKQISSAGYIFREKPVLEINLWYLHVFTNSLITNYETKTKTCQHLRVSLSCGQQLPRNVLFCLEFSLNTVSSLLQTWLLADKPISLSLNTRFCIISVEILIPLMDTRLYLPFCPPSHLHYLIVAFPP